MTADFFSAAGSNSSAKAEPWLNMQVPWWRDLSTAHAYNGLAYSIFRYIQISNSKREHIRSYKLYISLCLNSFIFIYKLVDDINIPVIPANIPVFILVR